MNRTHIPTAISVLLAAAGVARAQSGDPFLDAWAYNRDGRHGSSPNATINAAVSQILADVTRVRYTSTNIYINSNDIPSYPIGPWPNNPNSASSQTILVRVPRSPTPAASHTSTGLGPIGVLVNGVMFFNGRDGRSYNNTGVWNQNAMVVEGPNMDAAMGHPQMTGLYHHHCSPMSLREQLGDHGHCHSPLLGFAFDGYPVYGPFGYADPTDPQSQIVRMTSSYRTRTYPGGLRTGGPAVSATFPLGYYVEDFEYAAGLGTLDQYNGRVCKTPEFPAGVFAYFMTVDNNDGAVYPFIVGPQYYGVLLTDDQQRTVTVPGTGVTEFTPGTSFPCPQVCHQPQSQQVCRGTTLLLEADARYGAAVSYQWRKGGAALSDGATGAGSVISGAATEALTITGVALVDGGQYDCVITGPCGSLTTSAATLTVNPCCPADFNGDGSITPTDVAVFVNAWYGSLVAGTLAGDFDGNGVVAPADVAVFVTAWSNALSFGCP